MDSENLIRSDTITAEAQLDVSGSTPGLIKLCEPINSLLFLGHFEVGFSITHYGFLIDASFVYNRKKKKKGGSERLINFPKFTLKKIHSILMKEHSYQSLKEY